VLLYAVDLMKKLPSSARRDGRYYLDNPWVGSEPTPNGAYQQDHGAETLIDLVQSLLYRAHERRAVEDREHHVKVVEITFHELLQKVHVGELEKHRFGLKHGNQPLERGERGAGGYETGKITSGVSQNSCLYVRAQFVGGASALSSKAWLVNASKLLLP